MIHRSTNPAPRSIRGRFCAPSSWSRFISARIVWRSICRCRSRGSPRSENSLQRFLAVPGDRCAKKSYALNGILSTCGLRDSVYDDLSDYDRQRTDSSPVGHFSESIRVRPEHVVRVPSVGSCDHYGAHLRYASGPLALVSACGYQSLLLSLSQVPPPILLRTAPPLC